MFYLVQQLWNRESKFSPLKWKVMPITLEVLVLVSILFTIKLKDNKKCDITS